MSIYDFKHQEVYYVDEDTWEKYKLFKDVDCENKKYDDYKYEWKMVAKKNSNSKYGRKMISEKYQLIRGLTMGEFYRTGEVD